MKVTETRLAWGEGLLPLLAVSPTVLANLLLPECKSLKCPDRTDTWGCLMGGTTSSNLTQMWWSSLGKGTGESSHFKQLSGAGAGLTLPPMTVSCPNAITYLFSFWFGVCFSSNNALPILSFTQYFLFKSAHFFLKFI